MGTYDLKQFYELIDRYVKLTFLVKILVTQASKSAEEFNSTIVDIDFNALGLSTEIAMLLNSKPNMVNLRKHNDELLRLAEKTTNEIFGQMINFSNEEKILIKEYVDSMVADYLTKISECQDTYLGLVVKIDQSVKEENSDKTRALGKKAKVSFNKLYEYNTICQNYSNISSYLRAMIKNRSLK